MKKTIENYIANMVNRKNISQNTKESYTRDLKQMMEYFYMHGIRDYQLVNETNLNSYILAMELKGLSNASVARNIATMKGYFDYLFKQKLIENCITDDLKRPMVEKKVQKKADNEMIHKVLLSIDRTSAKGLRDYAMVCILCVSGMKTSEMIQLKIQDLNLSVGFVTCEKNGKQKMLPISKEIKEALGQYIENGREKILGERHKDCEFIFINMRGKAMTRQAVWKIIQEYSNEAGLEEAITPTMLSRTDLSNLNLGLS